MKGSKVTAMVGGLVLGVMGGMLIVTNPGQREYEAYATDALSTYLKQEVCNQVAQELRGALTSYCKTLVDTGRPQIQQIIAQKTIRANYLLFSIYETKLWMPSPVPSYQFTSLGIFEQFYTYEADEL